MGEAFVAGAEKVEFPGFRILRPVKTAPCGDDHGSRRIRTDHGGSREGGRVYTGLMPGAKMEIPDYCALDTGRRIVILRNLNVAERRRPASSFEGGGR